MRFDDGVVESSAKLNLLILKISVVIYVLNMDQVNERIHHVYPFLITSTD